MLKRIGLALLFGLLCGCEGGHYVPPLPHVFAPEELRNVVTAAAARYAVPPDLVRSVITAESGWDPNAVSPVGAEGLMQLMPGTARDCGVADPFDPSQNIDCGTRYLRSLLMRYRNVMFAVAAYNAGPGAVDRYGGVPPYPETRTYVNRVATAYNQIGRQPIWQLPRIWCAPMKPGCQKLHRTAEVRSRSALHARSSNATQDWFRTIVNENKV